MAAFKKSWRREQLRAGAWLGMRIPQVSQAERWIFTAECGLLTKAQAQSSISWSALRISG